jgi:hypothetical protein
MARESLQQLSSTAATKADGRNLQHGRLVGWLAWLRCAICLALAGLAIAFSLVGAVIAHRRPRHRLGWIFCTVGLSHGLVTFTSEYALYALWTAPGVSSASN